MDTDKGRSLAAAPKTPTATISHYFRPLKSPFMESENFMNQSPRKRMRLPSITNVSTNVTFQQHKVTRDERSSAIGTHKGFRGCTIWLTGLSGAGKTTIAFALEKTLIQLGIPAYGLDGDNIRHGLCKNLGFRKEDRSENIRRVAEVAKLFADMGVVTIASFISPFRSDRNEARSIHKEENLPFFEFYVSTPIEVCEARDPKKLYKRARAGQIQGFTGIDSIYEVPEHPDLVLNAGTNSETECLQTVFKFLYEKGILPEKAMYQLCGQPIRQLFVLDEQFRMDLLEEAPSYPAIEINSIDLQWLQVLAEGWASPLYGFMRERQYLQCLHFNELFDLQKDFATFNMDEKELPSEGSNNTSASSASDEDFPMLGPVNLSIPIVLPIHQHQKDQLLVTDGKGGERFVPKIRLVFEGQLVAILSDPEVFPHRKEERIRRQFGYSDVGHPVVRIIRESGDWLLGGDLQVLDRITYDDGLDAYRKTPAELRKLFTEANCDAVFAFQLRNPIHNGHALLMQRTREQLLKRYHNPMLLLHPLGGWTKDDDVPLAVRIAQHCAILDEGVLDPAWTVLAIFPAPMLYAGPTEVQWHARARLACGVNAYIVGRDPAGIQDVSTGESIYDPTHGAKVLSMAPGLPNLEILPFRIAAYDKTTSQMSFYDASRHEDFLFISGTMMRNFARNNQTPPDGFMPPKAWNVIASYYREIAAEAAADKNNDEAK